MCRRFKVFEERQRDLQRLQEADMLKILGMVYINTKEASRRYGFSVSWFERKRSKKELPRYVKLEGKSTVYYPLDETDQWFLQELK